MRHIFSRAERILPLLFWLLLMLGFDSRYVSILTLIAAAIHEAGHILVYLILRGDILLPFATADGFRIKPKKGLSYSEEALVALGGPMINLLVCLLFSPFSLPYLKVFVSLNLLTALSNLLPICGYDGHRIIKALICMRKTPDFSENLLSHISLVTSATLTFISLFFILKLGEGYWIFGIFFASLSGNIFKHCEQNKSEI